MKRNFLLIWLVMALFLVGNMVAIAQDTDPVVPTDDAEEVAEDIVDITTEAAESTAETVEDLIDRVVRPPENELAQILLVAGGVILLVLGWRIYEFIIIISGILVGAAIGANLTINSSDLIQIAAILIGGFIGAVLAAYLYFIAVFLIGAYIGVVLTTAAAGALDIEPVSNLVLLIAAILGGALLLGLSMELLILISAIVGAQMVVLALGLSAEWIIILAIVGVIVQIVVARQFGVSIRRRPSRRVYLLRRI